MFPIGTFEGERGMSTVLPELVTLLIMAFAVGMDAFSVALGMGVYKLRIRQIIYIGFAVGFFHLMMPLLGILGRTSAVRYIW